MMWEVRAADGRIGELVAWVEAVAVPEVLGRAGCRQVDVFDASDDRVVVIARFEGPVGRLPEPPAELLRRAPHTWPFRHLTSHSPGT
jgi:hypothetical protein